MATETTTESILSGGKKFDRYNSEEYTVEEVALKMDRASLGNFDLLVDFSQKLINVSMNAALAPSQGAVFCNLCKPII